MLPVAGSQWRPQRLHRDCGHVSLAEIATAFYASQSRPTWPRLDEQENEPRTRGLQRDETVPVRGCCAAHG